MKNKTDKPRRFRVGGYWAFLQGNEIKVVGKDCDGEDYNVASFTKEDVDKVKSILGDDMQRKRAVFDQKIDRLRALRDSLLASYNATRSEVDQAYRERPGRVLVPGLEDYASATKDDVTVGCTTISRRQFERIAKLLS